MHFFHCPSSQGQFICRHNHIRDAIMDQIGDLVDNQPGNEGPHIEVEWEPLVIARAPPTPDPPPSPPRAEGAMEVEAVVAPRFADGEEDGFIEEAGQIRKKTVYHRPSTAQHRGQSRRAAPRRPRSLRGRLPLNRGRGCGRRNRTLLSPTTPTASTPLQTSPSLAKNQPPQAFAGRDVAAAVTKTTKANTIPPVPASPVNRLQSSIESVRR
jgi:hypothetical protein